MYYNNNNNNYKFINTKAAAEFESGNKINEKN